jgi:flagellar basal-body rod protein FlgF
MIQGIYTAASGMAAHQARIDVLANNLANVDTPGFKADLISIDQSEAAGPQMSGGRASLSTVEPGRSGMNLASGILKPTGNPLDLAIVGPGLFVVQTPQGERYTRAGNFTRDRQGYLATTEGFRVLGARGPVHVPEGGLRLEAGNRIAQGDSLRIVTGPDGVGLVKTGGNLFTLQEGAATPAELPEPSVVQGHLESSNVNVVLTMVEMLAATRTYEAYQRTVQALDQTIGQAASDVGRP